MLKDIGFALLLVVFSGNLALAQYPAPLDGDLVIS
jgi:hypothetical protein